MVFPLHLSTKKWPAGSIGARDETQVATQSISAVLQL